MFLFTLLPGGPVVFIPGLDVTVVAAGDFSLEPAVTVVLGICSAVDPAGPVFSSVTVDAVAVPSPGPGVNVELGTCFSGVETELIVGGKVVFSLSLVVDGVPVDVDSVLLPSAVGITVIIVVVVVDVVRHPFLQHSLHSRRLHCFRLSSKISTSLLRQPDTI